MSLDPVTAAISWTMLERLREPEGNTVMIPCDNPDGEMFIEVNGDFTDYEDRQFKGPNVTHCLQLARQAQEEWNARTAMEFQQKLAALGQVQP